MDWKEAKERANHQYWLVLQSMPTSKFLEKLKENLDVEIGNGTTETVGDVVSALLQGHYDKAEMMHQIDCVLERIVENSESDIIELANKLLEEND